MKGMLKKFSNVLRKCKFFRTNQMEIAKKDIGGENSQHKIEDPSLSPIRKNIFLFRITAFTEISDICLSMVGN